MGCQMGQFRVQLTTKFFDELPDWLFYIGNQGIPSTRHVGLKLYRARAEAMRRAPGTKGPISLASLVNVRLESQPQCKLDLASSSCSDRTNVDSRCNLAKAFGRDVGIR